MASPRSIWMYIIRILNPLWIRGGTHRELIDAYFVSIYPGLTKKFGHKILQGLLFYVSFITLNLMYFSHGLFFNHFTHPPTWSKYFAYHPNLTFFIKIFKYMASAAIGEIFLVRLYLLFLHLKRRKKLDSLLKLEEQCDRKFQEVLIKWTQLLCIGNSCLGVTFCPLFFLIGANQADDWGKVIAIAVTLLCLHHARFAACDLFVIFSYVILLIHMSLKFSLQVVAISCDFAAHGRLNDYAIDSIKIRYYLIVKMINEAQVLVTFISGAANFMAVPIMALTWVLFFEVANSVSLFILKWFLFSIAFYYSVRVYLMNAYLSRVHSESKKLYANLNSLIAREQVSLLGKRKLLFIIENISGRANQMAFHDTYGSIVEQLNVQRSIFTTLELLVLTFAFKNNIRT